MGRKWAIIIALILGAAAVLLTNIYFQGKEQAYRVEEYQVVIASRDIAKGATIEYDMLAFKAMPADFIQPGALGAKEQAVGKAALVTIMSGEQVLETKLAAPGTGLTLAAKTPPGKRAFTLSTDSAAAVGGMVGPGDHVDVLAIFTNPPIIITLFQDILVLAVGGKMIPSEEKEKRLGIDLGGEETLAPSTRKENITLALTPQEVQVLTVAMEQGKIRLTLRPRQETALALPAVDLSSLPPAIGLETILQFYIRRAEPPPSVEVIRGLKKEVTTLPGK